MIDILFALETELPSLLADASGWKSLDITYHPPRVERLWRPWRGCRVYLHRIHPCAPHESLFHPHPWASAMRILTGTYEMDVGYGEGLVDPPIAATLQLPAGSVYEMVTRNSWHCVRPIGGPTLSVMVTGAPWDRDAPRSTEPLRPLTDEAAAALLQAFRSFYTWQSNTNDVAS